MKMHKVLHFSLEKSESIASYVAHAIDQTLYLIRRNNIGSAIKMVLYIVVKVADSAEPIDGGCACIITRHTILVHGRH